MSYQKKLRQIYEQLVKSTSGKFVVFHHVPRCGGTSVSRALRLRYILSQFSLNAKASYETIKNKYPHSPGNVFFDNLYSFRESLFDYALNSYIRCVSGHVKFNENTYDKFCNTYKYITVLRDPVQRYLSDYYANLNSSSYSSTIKSIEDYSQTIEGRLQANIFSIYFSGESVESILNSVSSDTISKAKLNLDKFDCIGFTDQLKIFSDDISKLLEIKIKVGYENRGPKQLIPNRQLANSTLENIREICKQDIEIYEYVKSKVTIQHPDNYGSSGKRVPGAVKVV